MTSHADRRRHHPASRAQSGPAVRGPGLPLPPHNAFARTAAVGQGACRLSATAEPTPASWGRISRYPSQPHPRPQPGTGWVDSTHRPGALGSEPREGAEVSGPELGVANWGASAAGLVSRGQPLGARRFLDHRWSARLSMGWMRGCGAHASRVVSHPQAPDRRRLCDRSNAPDCRVDHRREIGLHFTLYPAWECVLHAFPTRRNQLEVVRRIPGFPPVFSANPPGSPPPQSSPSPLPSPRFSTLLSRLAFWGWPPPDTPPGVCN